MAEKTVRELIREVRKLKEQNAKSDEEEKQLAAKQDEGQSKDGDAEADYQAGSARDTSTVDKASLIEEEDASEEMVDVARGEKTACIGLHEECTWSWRCCNNEHTGTKWTCERNGGPYSGLPKV